MPKKAFILPVASVAVAACALCWLTPLRGFQASAETAWGYPAASTQLFDASPIGGEPGGFGSATGGSNKPGADVSVKAQIFDPEALGSVRSRFSGTRAIARTETAPSTIEGRSVGTQIQPIPTIIKTSPAPRECEPRPSAGRNEPQFGSLKQNRAAG
jgi:hypothetical protein